MHTCMYVCTYFIYVRARVCVYKRKRKRDNPGSCSYFIPISWFWARTTSLMCEHGDRLTGDTVRKLWFSFAIPIARAHLPGLARVMELFEEEGRERERARATRRGEGGWLDTCVSRCLRVPSLFSVARSSIGGFSRGKPYVRVVRSLAVWSLHKAISKSRIYFALWSSDPVAFA